jgi:hypothetical protein
MCPTHHAEAETVVRTRLARANASNPGGWSAIIDASSRIDRPHLPNGLATKLASAALSVYVVSEPAELASRARFVIEATS